jgi:hypothetical protein
MKTSNVYDRRRQIRAELAGVWPPTAEVVRAAGHDSFILPLRAIRAKCLDCVCHQPNEVRLCEAVKCPLWPFRAGRYPIGCRQSKKPDTDPDFEPSDPFWKGSRVAP